MRRERSRRRGQILPRKVAVESAFAFDGKGSESPLKIGELSLGRLERRRAGLRDCRGDQPFCISRLDNAEPPEDLLGWSQHELAKRARVGVVTIHQLEAGISEPRRSTLDVIQRAFEAAGVEFTNGDQPGVRLAKSHPTTERG
jgi:DNA-binding XRE family transcriptional regulator